MRLHDLTAKHSELLLGCVGSGGREDMAFKIAFLPGQPNAFVCTYQVGVGVGSGLGLGIAFLPGSPNAFVCTYQVG